MDPARYQRLKALVHEAAGVPAGGRRAWLERACGEDRDLLEEAWGFLDGPGPDTRAIPAPAHETPFVLAPGVRLGRHVLGPELGRGGMGVVHEVVGEPGAPPLAVKVILPHVLALPSIRERFLREARLGLSLVDPHVVRTLEVGEARVGAATLHYLVMERLHGRTVRRILTEMGTVPEALVRELGAQAARGLAALHRAGIVHRDVKPENLLLADDRRLRVMDLGVAKDLKGEATLTSTGHFVGSIRYGAPEQWEGERVGPAADLYALGVVLYEALAGAPPFDGEGLLHVARARLESAPPPLASRAPQVSAFLATLVDALLATDPARRPASAEEVARRLEEGEEGAWWRAQRRAPRGAAPRAPRPGPPLVGRRADLEAILAAWAGARAGRGQVLLVEGEAGIGKTRLVEEALTAFGDDARVLRARRGEGEASVGVRRAVAAALEASDLEVEIARRLSLAPRRAAAVAAFLRREAPADEEDRLLASEGAAWTVRLVHALARETPLVFVVEDLHAAPEDSLSTVVALARGVAEHRVLLLLTSAPGLAPRARAALEAIPHLARRTLARLSGPEMADLLAAAAGDAGVGERLAAALARRCDGIPLFALELVKDLERRGHVVREPGGRLRLEPSFEDVALPGALRDVLRSRLEGLSPEERATLDAAAVAGQEFDPGRVASVRAVPRIHVLETLARLERREGLVRSGARTTRFDPQLLQEVLYAELPEALRAEAHGRLADAIEAEAPAPATAAQAALVAAHRIRGPEPARALERILPALHHLAATYRHQDALDLATRALALEALAPGPARVEVLLQAAAASRALGRRKDVEAWVEAAGALAEAIGHRGARLAAGIQRISSWNDVGRYEDALRASDAVLALAREDGRPAQVGEVLMRRGQSLWCLGRPGEAIAAHEEARRTAREAGLVRLEGRALSDLGVVHSEIGYPEEAERRYRESLERLRAAQDRTNEAVVETNLGNVMLERGRWGEALEGYGRALALAREVGDLSGEAFAWVNLGSTRLALGDLEGALDAYARCEPICRLSGLRRVESFVLHGRGTAAAWQGDRATARRRFEEALALRRALNTRLGLADTLHELGALDLAEGRREEARRHLDEAVAVAQEVGDPATEVLARLARAGIAGEAVGPARAAFEAHAARLRPDVRMEASLRLFEREGRREDLEAAAALLADLRARVPPAFAASFVERVPHRRAVARAASAVPGAGAVGPGASHG